MNRACNRMSDADFGSLVREARDRHDLSEIAGRHTTLKRRGAREMVGLCPFHNERTPSFEVNDAKGTYHCHGCGVGGDAITLLTELEGMAFIDAVKTLLGDEFPVISEEERAKRKEADGRLNAVRIDYARHLWSQRVPAAGTMAETYARARGVTSPLPGSMGFVHAPRFVDYETGETGREFPAVCCALQDATGSVTGVQLIFLSSDGTGKWQGTGAAKMTRGKLVGSALRLGPVRAHLVVVEGPEDGWTLMQQLPDHSVWAACGTANLRMIDWPDEVRSVCFAGDNGESGRNAVLDAIGAAAAKGRKGSSTFPDARFKDWNDQLRGIAA